MPQGGIFQPHGHGAVLLASAVVIENLTTMPHRGDESFVPSQVRLVFGYQDEVPWSTILTARAECGLVWTRVDSMKKAFSACLFGNVDSCGLGPKRFLIESTNYSQSLGAFVDSTSR